MKKFRGLLATTLAAAVMCTTFITVSAKSFSDVDAKKYSWCTEEITAMADEGIISGYPDGTFLPEKAVSKLESLVLVARVLGCNDEANSMLLENAIELYGERVSAYDISFGKEELCYLLLKGVIAEDELSDYIDDGVANSAMKRYDMAVLLTKGLGAEQEVKEKVNAELSYQDALQIPASARKHVEYVTKVGIMQGVGENKFAPMNNVTRAQAAVVLYKLNELTNYETFNGIVAAYDQDSRTIRFKLADGTNEAYTIIPSAVTLRCDGEPIQAEAITVGWEAIVSIGDDDMLAAVDFISTQSEGVVSGRLMSVTNSGSSTALKVETTTASGSETATYKVADEVVVTYDGEESNLAAIKPGCFVNLTIKKNKVSVIHAEPAQKTVKGTVTAVDLSNGVSLTVKVSGEEYNYFVKSNVKVSKNDNASTMADIVVGDKVTLKLEYNVVTNITASSTTTSDTGIVRGIMITDSPSLRIKIGSKVEEYPIARNAKILLNGKEGTIYDLRLNTNATISLESDTIIKISTSPNAEDAEVKGTVLAVNVSYNLIQVEYVDEATGTENIEQVFVKNGAKIISTTSTTDKKLKDIEAGQTITAMGSRSSGVFEATTIIIRN